jgi:hypothetical protein
MESRIFFSISSKLTAGFGGLNIITRLQLVPSSRKYVYICPVLDSTKKNTETLIDASKEVGLEINVDKTKYMLLSRDQNLGQNRDIKIANRSFDNVSQFKYLGTTVTNQNLIQEGIKRR